MPVTEKQIKELESFFAKARLPKELALDASSRLTDVRKFIDSHLNVLWNTDDKPIFDVFYARLLQVKELVK